MLRLAAISGEGGAVGTGSCVNPVVSDALAAIDQSVAAAGDAGAGIASSSSIAMSDCVASMIRQFMDGSPASLLASRILDDSANGSPSISLGLVGIDAGGFVLRSWVERIWRGGDEAGERRRKAAEPLATGPACGSAARSFSFTPTNTISKVSRQFSLVQCLQDSPFSLISLCSVVRGTVLGLATICELGVVGSSLIFDGRANINGEPARLCGSAFTSGTARSQLLAVHGS